MRPIKQHTPEEEAYVEGLHKMALLYSEQTWEHWRAQGYDVGVANVLTQTTILFMTLGIINKNIDDGFADIVDAITALRYDPSKIGPYT